MTFADFVVQHGIKYKHVSEFLLENKLQYAEYDRDKSGLVSGFNVGNPALRLGQLNPRPGKYLVYAIHKKVIPDRNGLYISVTSPEVLKPGGHVMITKTRPNTTKLNTKYGPSGWWFQTVKLESGEFATFRIV